MVLPHYMGRSAAMDIPTKKKFEQEKAFDKLESFSQSPEVDVPLLLPQDSEAVNILRNDYEFPKFPLNVDCAKMEAGIILSLSRDPKAEYVTPTLTSGLVDHVSLSKVQNHELLNQTSALSLDKLSDWRETQERGDLIANKPTEVGPRTSCHCQIIRSVSQWSAGTSQDEESIHRAYCSLIEQAEHFVYIENQFFISGLKGDAIIHNRVMEALYRRILQAYKQNKCFRVIVVIPLLPGFQGGMDDAGAATVRALMHWQYRTICRADDSILHKLKAILGPKTHEYISFYGMRTYGRLFDGGPLVTSQIYVHSKVMIIDDRISLLGSSNINDRSLLGSRDSEIGVVIEDKEFQGSIINGHSWMAGKFTLSLRLSLWAEHLGLCAEEIGKIQDPVSDRTYKNLWMETAETNTKIFEDIFGCAPNDCIHSKHAFRQKMSELKERIGYTTIDFGVAPEVITFCEDGQIKTIDPLEKIKSVKGHVVCFPLEFMKEEDLRPMFHEGEFYTSPVVFH